MDTIFSALGYTFLMGIVAYYYWIEGNKRGIKETIHIIMQHEPEALMRMRPKLKEILNETDA